MISGELVVESPNAVNSVAFRPALVKATPPPVPTPVEERTVRVAWAVIVDVELMAGQAPPVSTQLASQLADGAVVSDSGVLPLAGVSTRLLADKDPHQLTGW